MLLAAPSETRPSRYGGRRWSGGGAAAASVGATSWYSMSASSQSTMVRSARAQGKGGK